MQGPYPYPAGPSKSRRLRGRGGQRSSCRDPVPCFLPCCSFPGAAVKNDHKTECFRTTEIYCLIILKARSLKSASLRRRQGVSGPGSLWGREALGEKLSWFPPVSACSRRALTCGHITPISASVVTLLPYPWCQISLCLLHQNTRDCIQGPPG